LAIQNHDHWFATSRRQFFCLCIDDGDNEVGGSCGDKDDIEPSLLVYRDHSNRGLKPLLLAGVKASAFSSMQHSHATRASDLQSGIQSKPAKRTKFY